MPLRAGASDLKLTALIGLAFLAPAFAVVSLSAPREGPESLDLHAAEYLRLVAELAGRDPDSVDFHHDDGYPAVTSAAPDAIPLRSRSLAAHLHRFHLQGEQRERAATMADQLEAVASRYEQLSGATLAFDVELQRLFRLDTEVVSPEPSPEDRARLQRLLPGNGPLARRLAAYQRAFAVPRPRLQAALTHAIELCRERTRRFLVLPPGETISVEYVADKPWSGYSVYLGRYRSVVQINRVLSHSVDDVLTLACHEAYPGHHVYNSLREEFLLRGQSRRELGALPLFSPEGFRAEALTSAAASMTFGAEERARIFRDVLFPLVGVDPAEAARYADICALVDRLTAAAGPVVRSYLAADLTRNGAADALRKVAAMEHPDALLAYVDRYRAYSLAYTVGRDRFLLPLLETGDEGQRWALLRRFILEAAPGRR